MGCGSSVPPEIEIVEETSSVPPPEVDDTVRSEKVAAGDARGNKRAGIRGMALAFEYPFYAVHMRDFLNLKTLKTHNELKADGLVVPLDFDGLHAGACVNFISHQWLGDGEADPEGVHLCTMQQCFSRVITNEPIFRSPEDEAAYLKGVHIYVEVSLLRQTVMHACGSIRMAVFFPFLVPIIRLSIISRAIQQIPSVSLSLLD